MLVKPLKYINDAKETVNIDRRELSINLGGGNCLYTGADPVVSEEIDFHKTIIAGFPSSDKRMVYQQMEALTGYRKFGVCSRYGVCLWCDSLSISLLHANTHSLGSIAAKSEWDFKYVGMSNHPFIKVNYPHHEGIWSWGNVADQVVLLITNLRKSIVECECLNVHFGDLFLGILSMLQILTLNFIFGSDHAIEWDLECKVYCSINSMSHF